MWTDLKFALRQLHRNPLFAIVVVLTLALGTGVNTAIFSLVDAVLLKPLPFSQPERIVTLWESSPERGVAKESVTPPNLAEWKWASQSFEAMGYWTAFDANVLLHDEVRRTRRAHVSSEFFSALGMAPILGRSFTAEEDHENSNRAAIISHAFWQTAFGGRGDVLGKTVTVDTYGRREYTITGVMPRDFSFPDETELWLNAGWNGIPRARHGHWLNVVGRLKPGVTIERAQAEMDTIQKSISAANPGALLGTTVAVVPLAQQIIGPRLRPALLTLCAVVAGVLLIACANVANLFLARALARRKELTIRTALGASSGRIVRQLLMESVTLALIAGILGALIGSGGLELLRKFGPADFPRLSEVRFDWRALLFTIAISTASGVLFGLAPAWQFSRGNLERTLRESGHSASSGRAISRVRRCPVVGEIAVSLLLLVSAGLMIDSFAQLLNSDRGFKPANLVAAELDFSVTGYTTWIRPTETRPQIKLKQLLDSLGAQPGVEIAAAASGLPRRDSGPPTQPFFVVGRAQELAHRADYSAVSPRYFEALGVPLLRGRAFTENDRLEAPSVVIINQTLARRYFPGENPIGQRLSMSRNPSIPDNSDPGPGSEIVGIVKDVARLGVNSEAHPQVYSPYWQWPMLTPLVIVRANGDPRAVQSLIRSEVKRVIPNIPAPGIKTMDDIFADFLTLPRFQTWLLSAFGALAALLAAIGLYGTLAYLVANRTKEFAIRMTLGAEPRRVLCQVIAQGMKLAALGTALGFAMTAALSKLLESAFFGVTPNVVLPATAAALGLGLVALAASWIPALRATNVNPMEAIRAE